MRATTGVEQAFVWPFIPASAASFDVQSRGPEFLTKGLTDFSEDCTIRLPINSLEGSHLPL